jgi:hypothetical protein
VAAGVALFLNASADWPMLKGNGRHDGYASGELKPPFRLAWARHFLNERLGTAMEPIVADGKVLVATHGGTLCALDAATGNPQWRFQAHGAFLQSPACGAGLAVAASVDGRVYAVKLASGETAWQSEEFVGGFSASPVIDGGRVYIGSRGGTFVALRLSDGRVEWRQELGVPVRQTAAAANGRVVVTAEDLRVRSWGAGGDLAWTSEPLAGQSARDYYPVLVEVGGKSYVVVRTSPARVMSDRIARDSLVLAKNAGVEGSDWRQVEAWTRSEAARGNAEFWSREQGIVREHLNRDPGARTFFLLDAATGLKAGQMPVLWMAGCQGVGVPPVVLPDGRIVVLNRSAYGNWSRGVAPLVSLGVLDPVTGSLSPLFHDSGTEPPWNTFWGTADETQSLGLCGRTLLLVHQGTLSGFDLEGGRLFPIWGERDTFGGFPGLAWARNEWHGPGRGGVAVDGGRLFWITGSRLLCVQAGAAGEAGKDQAIDLTQVPGAVAPKLAPIETAAISARLQAAVRELITAHWAPLCLEPGLGGREFLFDEAGALFESVAWSFPFLGTDLQKQVRRWMGEEWENFPPYSTNGWSQVSLGKRREWAAVERDSLARSENPPHPFARVCAALLYAERCGEMKFVLQKWDAIRMCFEDFERTGWKLDPAKGDRDANAYLASMIALAVLADKAGDQAVAKRAGAWAEATTDALAAWWRRAAQEGPQPPWKGVADVDAFIGRGNALSFRLAPHRHRVALFHRLTPLVAARIKARAPEAVASVWEEFERTRRTWALVGEERQLHSGENAIDSPELAFDAFQAFAWLREPSPAQLARRVDIPFCRADLAYIGKLALVLEAAGR